MKILKRLAIIIALIVATISISYYWISNEKFYFSGIYVSAFYGENSKKVYINNPDLFFEKGEFSAIAKKYFFEEEVFLEQGQDYSLISKDDQDNSIEEKKFNITPNEYEASMYYPSTGMINQQSMFKIMFITVLKYSEKTKKIQFYRGSKLIAETNVKNKL